eukprot:CAMPEP_0198300496 /NCGR_PEP_ID=MMETSP1449-20131203/48436_1 /TAXON_ID=420275 /ORGANISM="Attheya septentrionalis, Strain CCMP2084" /LENGTH=261 /DNA_ID=CAMNT_0044002345 /DNA_START=43 /DNA_END=825 /DNA_ORIENTATION=-
MDEYANKLLVALRKKGGKMDIGPFGNLVKKPTSISAKPKAIITMHSDKFALEKRGTDGNWDVYAVERQDHNFDRPSLRYVFRALISIHAYYSNRVWPTKFAQWRSDYKDGMGLLDQGGQANTVYSTLNVEGYVKKKGGTIVWNIPRIQDAVNQMPDDIKSLPLSKPPVSQPTVTAVVTTNTSASPIPFPQSSGPSIIRADDSTRNKNGTAQQKVWSLSDGTVCTFVDNEPFLRQCIENDPILQASGEGQCFVAIDCEGVPG